MDLEFLFCHFLIIIPIIEFVLSDNASTKTNFEKELRHYFKKNSIFPRGSIGYNKKRLVHNGLCANIYPDWIVVPHRTEDVAFVVKLTNKYNISISVRSGGHSYTCTNIRQGGVHFDMREMNHVGLVNNHLAVLGPGGTWGDVLEKIPPSKFTMLHGQCLSVGVAGYLLGGGINYVGTSERYGSGARHVVRYTMVDALGRILLVSNGNTTVIEPNTRRGLYQLENDSGLYKAMGGAGSSFGITTEFLYRIYPRPEVLPTLALVYLENSYDLYKLEKAAMDGRYHVHAYIGYAFRDLNIFGVLPQAVFIKVIPRILKYVAQKSVEPVYLLLVDNDPYASRNPNKQKALNFLKEFGLNLALNSFFTNLLPSAAVLSDYESVYMSPQEYNIRGFQGIASANLMGISNLSIIRDILFNHPTFGLKYKEKIQARKAGCEFCFFVIHSSNRSPQNQIFNLTFSGKFQLELTCLFPPNVGSKCPKVLRNIKEQWRRKSIQIGDRPTQYYNIPSCDKDKTLKSGERYFNPDVYEELLKTKHKWDPENKFNHCQSIGNDNENCCPS